MYTIEKGVLKGSINFFHTPSHLAKSIFFHPLCLGLFICDHQYAIQRDHYASYLIMYIEEGNGIINYDGKEYTAQSGDVILLNCYKPHSYSTTGWKIVWMHFDGNVSKDFFDILFNRFGVLLRSPNSINIYTLLIELLDNFSTQQSLDESMLSCQIHKLLSELFILSSDSASYTETSTPIQNAIAYMKQNYKSNLSICDIAQHIALSPYHFSRVFKTDTGYSPYEYLMMLRINESKYLLKNTDMLIKEITFEIGFNSESNFVTSFKNHVGYTPTQFRNLPI